MTRKGIRAVAELFRRTPLHPQWLLGTSQGLRSLIRDLPPGLVLDVGCASRWVERILPGGCHYVGLDSQVTGKALYDARPDVYADASRLPLSDGSVDTVMLLEVVEHLPRPGDALAEAARVLKAGGRLILTMPFLYPVHDAPHDYQRYTEHGLVREIEAAGFRVGEGDVKPGLGSAETAGLVACLALGGMLMQALERRSPALLLAPLLVLSVPFINLVCWLLGRLLPDWPALTAGYQVVASKP